MNLKKVGKDIDNLVKHCEVFLSVQNMSEEEKKKLNEPCKPLQITTFNKIIDECKEEVKKSDLKKINEVLNLLYKINSEPFEYETISKALDAFVTNQLKSSNLQESEESLKTMMKIAENIQNIQESLLLELKRLNKEAQKIYVFNKLSRNQIVKHHETLEILEKQLYVQMEYDSKKITKKIIDDFYNTYIFLSYIIKLSIEKNQYLLAIEVANAVDRYIDIVSLVFNGRHLKNQDMLYHYLIYELNELKNTIYEGIGEHNI